MANVVKRLSGLPCRFGGEEHSGWLPPHAAKPLPTPVEDVVLDLEIMEEAGGFLLAWSSRDGRHHGDLWFETAEAAQQEAERGFGARRGQWQHL